jgi:hypothetical protein
MMVGRFGPANGTEQAKVFLKEPQSLFEQIVF